MSESVQSARRSLISRAKPVGVTLCAGRPPHRSAYRERTTQSSARATVIQPTEFQIQNRQRTPSSSRRLAVVVRAKTEQFINFFSPSEKIFLNRRFSSPPSTDGLADSFPGARNTYTRGFRRATVFRRRQTGRGQATSHQHIDSQPWCCRTSTETVRSRRPNGG